MPLRWGVLGTSFISHTVAAAINSSPKSTIVSVFGRDVTRLEDFAKKFEIPKKYTNAEDLLKDDEVDVVYIGLPSHLHAEYTIAATKHGKAILSEKSLATTLKDAEDMLMAASDTNTFFLEGLMYLCHPFMTKLGEIIKSGRLGQIKGVQGYYAANIWKKANPLGMGTIYNLGCYPVSLLHFVFQSAYNDPAQWAARRVVGFGNLSDVGKGTDAEHARDASLMAQFENGLIATIQSTDSFGNDFGFTIQGDKAVLKFKTNPWLPSAGSNNVMEIREYKGETETVTVDGEWDAFGYQVKLVEDCVAKGLKNAARPAARPEDSREIMKLLLEWEEDLKQRQTRN